MGLEAVIKITASLGITNEESDTKHSDRLSLSSLLLIDLYRMAGCL